MKHDTAIVLVGPQGDANIGAAARAMKNFGFSDLRIVGGVPHETREAGMWAVDARDVLEGATRFADLNEALGDVTCAIAFTRRIGRSRKRSMDVAQAADWITSRAENGPAAIVFGREDAGLTNDEVKRCDAVVEIPTSAQYPSLNLAQAVLIACYEVSRGSLRPPQKAQPPRDDIHKFVPKSEITPMLEKFGLMLSRLRYEDIPGNPIHTKIMGRLEKLFGRAGLTCHDVRMFEGLIERISSRL